MRTLRFLLAFSCLALLCSILAPQANADEWDKKTIVTFSGPVEVSGHHLDAGTYVFKLADSQSDRHIVQIFNADESHIIYTILAIPDWRVTPTGKTTIKFSEKAGQYATAERDLPEAGIPVKEWFYPGDNFGQEFIVKPAPVVQTAETTTTTQETTPSATLEAQPAPEPVPQTAEVQPPPEQPAPAPAQPQEAPAPAAQTSTTEMPQTASPMPLIGLIGLSSLGAALALREALKRMA